MMKDTRNSRIKTGFILIATTIVLLYIYIVSPVFLTKIDALRAENKQIEYDLEDIKKIGSDTTDIREEIASAKSELAVFTKRTEVDGTNYDMDISGKADETDVTINEMIIGEKRIIKEQAGNGKSFYLQPVTISYTAKFSDGIKFIEALEKSESGIYEVQDFLYSGGEDDGEKSWMISINVYYYEEHST